MLFDLGMVGRLTAQPRRGQPAFSALDIDTEPVWSALEFARDRQGSD